MASTSPYLDSGPDAGQDVGLVGGPDAYVDAARDAAPDFERDAGFETGAGETAANQAGGFRLGDAEHIAAQRLESVLEGSLREALARWQPQPAAAATWDEAPPVQPIPPVDQGPQPAIVPDAPPPVAADTAPAAVGPSVEANAAAALENLKHLLNHKIVFAGPEPLPELQESEPPRVHQSAPPPPPQRPPQPPVQVAKPPPLPVPAPMRAAVPSRQVMASVPKIVRDARAMQRERSRFDVRGFFAGFALSWAIGAVLYLYITAG